MTDKTPAPWTKALARMALGAACRALRELTSLPHAHCLTCLPWVRATRAAPSHPHTTPFRHLPFLATAGAPAPTCLLPVPSTHLFAPASRMLTDTGSPPTPPYSTGSSSLSCRQNDAVAVFARPDEQAGVANSGSGQRRAGARTGLCGTDNAALNMALIPPPAAA